MKNLQSVLITNVEGTKFEQKSQRAMKAELVEKLKSVFEGCEIFEDEKGFNVELFDGEGDAFIVNVNPVIKALDFDALENQNEVLADRAEKEANAKARKEAAEKRKAAKKIK